jgi:hypothetical protein
MGVVFQVNTRNLVALLLVSAVLGVGYLLSSDPVVRYGAWLIVFAIWMSWFVFAGIEWLRNANF